MHRKKFSEYYVVYNLESTDIIKNTSITFINNVGGSTKDCKISNKVTKFDGYDYGWFGPNFLFK